MAVILAWLIKEAERQPLLSVWEDLQWLDPSSLEFLRLHLAQATSARTLIVLTFRPEFQPPWEQREQGEIADHFSQIALDRLGQDQARQMVEHVMGKACLASDVIQQVVSKTDGVPLFVEELTKTVIESLQPNGHTAPASIAIPATLHDSLMARLDRLVQDQGTCFDKWGKCSQP